jgi:8-oxo-dGTP pyrophosphatase MutT (NUDIX family)
MILDPVKVVVGIIFHDRKFLVEHRSQDEDIDPGAICLPGGHVEPNESLTKALKREMWEELNIRVLRCYQIYRGLHLASNGEFEDAHYFFVEKFQGMPINQTAQALSWEDNIQTLTLALDREAIQIAYTAISE